MAISELKDQINVMLCSVWYSSITKGKDNQGKPVVYKPFSFPEREEIEFNTVITTQPFGA